MTTRQERIQKGRQILKQTNSDRVYSLNDLSPDNYLGINYTYWLFNILRPFDCVDEKYYNMILLPILNDYAGKDDAGDDINDIYVDDDNCWQDGCQIKNLITKNVDSYNLYTNKNNVRIWNDISSLKAELYIDLYTEALNDLNLDSAIKEKIQKEINTETFHSNAPERFKLLCDMYRGSDRYKSKSFFIWFYDKLEHLITTKNDGEKKQILDKLLVLKNANNELKKWNDLSSHLLNPNADGSHVTEITMFLKTQMGVHYNMEHIEMLLQDAKLVFRAEHLNLIDRELLTWQSLFDQINNALDAAQFEHKSFVQKVNLDSIKLEKTFGSKLKTAAMKVGIKLGVGGISYVIGKITSPASPAIKEVTNTAVDTVKKLVEKITKEAEEMIGKEGKKIVFDAISDKETLKDFKNLVPMLSQLENIKDIFTEKGLTDFLIKHSVQIGMDIPAEYKISQEAMDELKGIESSIELRSFLNNRLNVLRQASIDVVDVTPDVDFQMILDYVYYQTLMGFKVGLGTYNENAGNEAIFDKHNHLIQQQDSIKTKLPTTKNVKKLEGINLVRKARNMLEKAFEQKFAYTLKEITINPKYKDYLSGEGFLSLRRRIELQLWAEWIQNFVDICQKELVQGASEKTYYQKTKEWIKGFLGKQGGSNKSQPSVDEFITNYRKASDLRDNYTSNMEFDPDYAKELYNKEKEQAHGLYSDPLTSNMVKMLCKMDRKERNIFLEQQNLFLKNAAQTPAHKNISMKDIMSDNLSKYLSVRTVLGGKIKGFRVENFQKVIDRMVKLADAEKIYIDKIYKIDQNALQKSILDSTVSIYYRWLETHTSENLALNNLLDVQSLSDKQTLYKHLYKNKYFTYSPFLDLENIFPGQIKLVLNNNQEYYQKLNKVKERDFLLFD